MDTLEIAVLISKINEGMQVSLLLVLLSLAVVGTLAFMIAFVLLLLTETRRYITSWLTKRK